MARFLAWALAAAALAAPAGAAGESRPIKLLFLGDSGLHRPAERFAQLQPVMARRGIDIVYTDKASSLDPQVLAGYDGLIVYTNTTQIAPEQEKALLDFVEAGKGLVALHCASFCFLNSPAYIDLVGAQFLRHGTGTFRTTIVAPDHPTMQGFAGFESWDETYVHTKHNPQGRTVLETRAEGDTQEPWTWVRAQGKGRVFYTAWGHDQRTWGHPGFQNLVERGIRWATGHDPADAPRYSDLALFPIPRSAARRTDVAPFEYVDVGKKIPNYTRGAKWGAQGEPLSRMQAPLSPAESLKHVVVPERFHVELFASEPELGGKPIAMQWDERGRLWLCETYDYPNHPQPLGAGSDRIRICEDTDGDGKADKFTVFADKLSIPSSVAFSRDGAIVFEAGRTVFLKDVDGDDVADERTPLFGAWSQTDTHGGPSNMQYGLDNWIWGMQGYNRSRLEVGGQSHEFRQGFFRFRPDGSKLEFLRSTDNNTWGLGISEQGIVFGSTANCKPSVYLPIANRYYEAVRGWAPSLTLDTIADTHLFHAATDKVRQVDHFGGYTAAAGHALYTARAFPQEYRNRTAFVCEPTGHLVGVFVLTADGADFRATNPFNLFASDDEWTAPTMAEVGPDGNIWVIDWYNYIVQHNPTPIGFETGKGSAYETDLRDKKHARIYRVVYDGAAERQRGEATFTLAGATPQKLVATLKHPNLFWRRHAQRLLVERSQTDVLPDLAALVRDPAMDEIGLNVGAIHALSALHGLGVLDGSHPATTSLAIDALRHPSAGVRRNALQVLPRREPAAEAILAAGLLLDSDAQVRLAALLALADQPAAPRIAEALLGVFSRSADMADRWIPDAAICAAASHGESFLRALPGVQNPSARLLTAASIVAEHQARGGPFEGIGPLIAGLADAAPPLAEAVIQGLAKGWPKDRPIELNAGLEDNLDRLAARIAPERRAPLVRLATTWRSQRFEKYAAEISGALLARVADELLESGARIAAAGELLAYRPDDRQTIRSLVEQITPRTESELAVGLLRAMGPSEAEQTGELILEKLPSLTPAVRAAGMAVLLSRPAWTTILLGGAEHDKIQLTDLALDQRQSLAEHPDREVRRRAQELLRRRGDLPNADRQKVLTDLLSAAKASGDPAAGKQIFARHCAKCHVHGDQGQRVGPDLTGTAVHSKEELLANIVDPSRSVEGNFRVYTLTTTGGRVLVGLLASESKTAIELFDSEGKRQTILRDEIDALAASSKSLMPEGFEKQITAQELADLLEFLTQRGKYLPLPLEKVATGLSTRGMFYSAEAEMERLVFDDWKPKVFEGVVFQLVDPQQDQVPNAILLYGPKGQISSKMPKAVSVTCNAPAKAIHLLSGVSGWGFPLGKLGSVSMIVRLHYAGGGAEDHELTNGEHFADYIRRVDVPGSKFAFDLGGRQMRYLAITPKRQDTIERIELIKGPDDTAPVVMAVTIESPASATAPTAR